jgi:hypothetical protein
MRNLSTMRFCRSAAVMCAVLGVLSSPAAAGDPVSEACALGVERLLPQGPTPTIAGGGEITTSPATLSAWGAVDPDELGDQVANRLQPPQDIIADQPAQLASEGMMPQTVLLMIVDDFTSVLTTQTGRSHGDYVLEAATTAYTSLASSPQVDVRTVDYGPQPTVGAVLTSITNAYHDLSMQHNYSAVVLNLSWVILPCEGAVQLEDNTLPLNLADYYGYIAENVTELDPSLDPSSDGIVSLSEWFISTNGLDFAVHEPRVRDVLITYALANFYELEAVVGTLGPESEAGLSEISGTHALNARSLASDAALAELEELLSGSPWMNVLAFAAAGNYSKAVAAPAMAPAAWAGVIAVGGTTANDQEGRTWGASHNGQLVAPAAWHPSLNGEYAAGTSFATPYASVLAGFVMAYYPAHDLSALRGILKDANMPYVCALLPSCVNPAGG